MKSYFIPRTPTAVYDCGEEFKDLDRRFVAIPMIKFDEDGEIQENVIRRLAYFIEQVEAKPTITLFPLSKCRPNKLSNSYSLDELRDIVKENFTIYTHHTTFEDEDVFPEPIKFLYNQGQMKFITPVK